MEQISAEDLLGLPEETSQSQPIAPVRQAQAPAEDLLLALPDAGPSESAGKALEGQTPAEDLLLGLRDAVPAESAGKVLDGPTPAEDLLLGLPQSLPCSQVGSISYQMLLHAVANAHTGVFAWPTRREDSRGSSKTEVLLQAPAASGPLHATSVRQGQGKRTPTRFRRTHVPLVFTA